ncbi:MAG: hypothetical protein ACLS4Z_08050 [Christensenellaceae bacterium]
MVARSRCSKPKKLGGMLRYGISYRLRNLDRRSPTSSPQGLPSETPVGDNPILGLKGYDAVYIAIGAQTDKRSASRARTQGRAFRRRNAARHQTTNARFQGKDIVVIGSGSVISWRSNTPRREAKCVSLQSASDG